MEEAEIIWKIEQVQNFEFLKYESMINSEKIFIWKEIPSLKDWKHSDSYRLQEHCNAPVGRLWARAQEEIIQFKHSFE